MDAWRSRWPSKGHNCEEEVEEAATSKCLTQPALNICTWWKQSIEQWPGYLSVGSKPGLMGSVQKENNHPESDLIIFRVHSKENKYKMKLNSFDLNSTEGFFRRNCSCCPYPTSDSVNAPKVWALINSCSLLRADNWRPIIPVMEYRHVQAVSLQFTQHVLG